MSNSNRPILFTEDSETIPADEADDIRRVIEALEGILARNLEKTGQFRADVHVKTHGYAHAEFRVLPNLPQELAQGLFERDIAYPAIVRFSSASSQPQPDVVPDGRGMAVKVLNVEGEAALTDQQNGQTQDFIMINHPVFFARNVKDYLRFEQVLEHAEGSTIATLQGGLTGGDWNPLHWHWREMLTAAQIAGQLPAHPASNTYYSMAPIRFGAFVAKYRVKPISERRDTYLELLQQLATQADAMRLALEAALQSQELLFEFQVQLRTSERMMPIEDASVEWPESESPYRTVAHLLLPRQQIESLRHQAAYQDLAFDVWHALDAHRPLGGINRVRRWVYPLSASWRRQHTEVAPGNSLHAGEGD